MDMSWLCALTARTVTHILGCIKSSVASRVREGKPPRESCIQLRSPQLKKDMNLLEQVQRRAMKKIRGLEELSYEERLRELRLLEKNRPPCCGLSIYKWSL